MSPPLNLNKEIHIDLGSLLRRIRPWPGAVTVVVLIHGLGALLWHYSRANGFGRFVSPTRRLNIFYALFESNELWGLLVSFVVLILAVGAAFWRGKLDRARSEVREEAEEEHDSPSRDPSNHGGARLRWILALALATCAVCWVGSRTVYHSHPFSMDEYGAEFQAQIFLSGALTAPLPEAWIPFKKGITPIFVTVTDEQHWVSFYLPVYALMRAASLAIHPRMLLNPILAGLAVLLIALVARRAFPDFKHAGWLAALLLATSSQLLVDGMSFYSMTAHLAFNLLWLWLYLEDRPWSWVCLAILGFLSMGLHQFVMHVLFAFPFLFRWVLQRRWILSVLMASTYCAGLYGWMAWVRWSRSSISVNAMARDWGFPGFQQWVDQGMNLSMMVTWQAPVVAVLVCFALFKARKMSPFLWDAAFSVGLTLLFYCFFKLNQGHGWGYRYFVPVLGNWVLLAVFGWKELAATIGKSRAATFAAVGLLGAAMLVVPVRMAQVSSFVQPFADATRFLESQDVEMVLIDGGGSWYGWDLLRNDPFFRHRPVIVSANKLKRGQVKRLIEGREHRWVSPQELESLGMVPRKGRRRVFP